MDDSKVVASVQTIGKNKVMVCNYSLLDKQAKEIPLSLFTEELQIVKLDSRDEALIAPSSVLVTDNYILIRNENQNPCKLFDKQGKFLTNVGAIGQGPGEYQLIYDEQIDEKNGRIYLLPWSAKNLLVYDLTGKYLESIPLGTIAAKGKFFVNPKESVIGVAQLATSEQEAIAYSMKTSGERIGSIKPRHLAVSGQGIFNNEVISDKNTDANDVSFLTMPRKPDTLYHYDIKNNALVPRFTTDFPEQVEINSYTELPNHYMATVAVNEQVTETTTSAKERRYYVVDKETMKGSFFNLKNDFLGRMDIDRPYFGRPIFSFRNGYYLENMDPSNLQEAIAKHLSSNQDMTAEMRDKLTKLSGSISENDNNYILYAKLKK